MGKLTPDESEAFNTSLMKINPPASINRNGRSTCFRLLCIGSALVVSSITAGAQAVGNFDGETIAPALPEKEKKEKPKVEPGPVNTAPSRYVGTDLEAYVVSFAAVFPMSKRETDPFGRMQDPDAKPPVIKPVMTKTEQRVPEAITPFADLISRIEVTTIMPGDKRILVGNRSISENDELPLHYRGRQIKALVAEVSSRRIVFKNVESGETGVRELNLLPVGMTPGNKQIMAPGMVPLDSNAPLNLDVEVP